MSIEYARKVAGGLGGGREKSWHIFKGECMKSHVKQQSPAPPPINIPDAHLIVE